MKTEKKSAPVAEEDKPALKNQKGGSGGEAESTASSR